MTNYDKGTAFENRVKAKLLRLGFAVTRSAGSHGVADVIATDETRCLHIQCKAKPLSKMSIVLEAERIAQTIPKHCGAVVAHKSKTGKLLFHVKQGGCCQPLEL